MGNNYCQAKMHRRGPLFQHQLTIAKCSGVRSGGMGKSLPPPRTKKRKGKKGEKKGEGEKIKKNEEERRKKERKSRKEREKRGKGKRKDNKIAENR